MPYRDHEKQRVAEHDSYLRNKSVVVARMLSRKRVLREWVGLIKHLFGCRDCGENNSVVLDFHHVGVKRAKVAYLVSNGRSRARILQEIGQCAVLCSNCHSLKTHEDSVRYRT